MALLFLFVYFQPVNLMGSGGRIRRAGSNVTDEVCE